jgi:hypothetical protein
MIFLSFCYHQSVLQMASIVAQIEIMVQIDDEEKFESILKKSASMITSVPIS